VDVRLPKPCPFWERLAAGEVTATLGEAAAFPDGYPLSPGRTLVVPRTHTPDLTALPAPVRGQLWELVHLVTQELRRQGAPDGFNIGVNIGAAAGQTVDHAHIHVIPRYRGDVPDPRGGVRWALPDKAAYWDRP
jgi:diadenosine tetraphosphate (Ap4A) HIT family hydrolase